LHYGIRNISNGYYAIVSINPIKNSISIVYSLSHLQARPKKSGLLAALVGISCANEDYLAQINMKTLLLQ
jgi:hypothetical protein